MRGLYRVSIELPAKKAEDAETEVYNVVATSGDEAVSKAKARAAKDYKVAAVLNEVSLLNDIHVL